MEFIGQYCDVLCLTGYPFNLRKRVRLDIKKGVDKSLYFTLILRWFNSIFLNDVCYLSEHRVFLFNNKGRRLNIHFLDLSLSIFIDHIVIPILVHNRQVFLLVLKVELLTKHLNKRLVFILDAFKQVENVLVISLVLFYLLVVVLFHFLFTLIDLLLRSVDVFQVH